MMDGDGIVPNWSLDTNVTMLALALVVVVVVTDNNILILMSMVVIKEVRRSRGEVGTMFQCFVMVMCILAIICVFHTVSQF